MTDLSPPTLTRALQERIGRTSYRMWFGHAVIGLEDGVLQVSAASRFEADWITRRFAKDLDAIAADVGATKAHVHVQIRETAVQDPEQTLPEKIQRSGRPRRRLYDLDDLVVGASNQLAWTAARTIVDDPAAHHLSPLFIHGDCGVGKTHLLQGICVRFGRQNPGAPMRYMTGEEFTNEFIQAVRHSQLEQFRRSMRRLHLLAVDDVHFVAGKTRTQDEVLHTLDAIRLSGARIVLASDAHPNVIKRFNTALVSRCTSGMLVQVEMPDEPLRRAVLERVSLARGLTLTPSAIDAIVEQCPNSVREIHGLLARVGALKAMRQIGGPVTGADVAEATAEGRLAIRRPVTVEVVMAATCGILGVQQADLGGTGRAKRVVLARGLIAMLARELTTASYPEIAMAMGRRTHSSVHASVKRLLADLKAGRRVDLDGQSLPLEQLLARIRRRTGSDTGI
ncbi:MAG: DnaA/Hda family protein [Phycisphaerales bacterium]|nr:DnaA/Hda family protein [Phycisphaerales bacterium]MDP6890203.1 DnaA/Hda family protein [Phycisphaerales bacterium]